MMCVVSAIGRDTLQTSILSHRRASDIKKKHTELLRPTSHTRVHIHTCERKTHTHTHKWRGNPRMSCYHNTICSGTHRVRSSSIALDAMEQLSAGWTSQTLRAREVPHTHTHHRGQPWSIEGVMVHRQWKLSQGAVGKTWPNHNPLRKFMEGGTEDVLQSCY
jgi:hypothetical protein